MMGFVFSKLNHREYKLCKVILRKLCGGIDLPELKDLKQVKKRGTITSIGP
jgi:hypothetical protein